MTVVFFVVCMQIAYQMILNCIFWMRILNKKGISLKRQLKQNTILIIYESCNKIKILVYIHFKIYFLYILWYFYSQRSLFRLCLQSFVSLWQDFGTPTTYSWPPQIIIVIIPILITIIIRYSNKIQISFHTYTNRWKFHLNNAWFSQCSSAISVAHESIYNQNNC